MRSGGPLQRFAPFGLSSVRFTGLVMRTLEPAFVLCCFHIENLLEKALTYAIYKM